MTIRFPRVVHTGALAAWLLACPARAWAHAGRAPEPHDLWHSWNAAPFVVLGLLLGTVLYLRGVRRLWSRAGRGRAVAGWRVGCWLGAMAAVALALLSPIDAVAEALFSVHMVQHLLLIMAAAPLMVLGEPLLPVLFALPLGARRAVGRQWHRRRTLRAAWHWLTTPVVAWTLHVGTLVLWHLPPMYDRAVLHEPVHVAEHLSFLLTALLFWWVVAGRPARHRLGTGSAVVYLFGAALASTLFGAAIALAPRPWYPVHWGTTAAWGLNPLEDQQVAGLIMWIPAGVVYLVALAAVLVPALRAERTGTPLRGELTPAGSPGTPG